jgi:hypothetical protein
MDVSRFVAESAAFTHATLAGKPSRWLIFILLGLPWMVLSSLLESRKILEGTTIHWNLIPWQEAGLLISAGILCNLLVSGWVVRLLRDDPLPPDFDRPLLLCLDGMKFHAIPLVWMLVPSVLAFVQYSVAGSSTVSINLWQPDPTAIFILVLLAIQILILFIAVQYATIGTIRFARTGSVGEGLAILEIRKTISRIGIVNYYVALGVVTIVWLLFSLCLRGVALVPLAGPAISLCLSPVPTVYCFRFIAHFCDEERLSAGRLEGKTGAVQAFNPLNARALVPEFLAWMLILAVLVLLCFTPMVLIVSSVTRYLP